jgi:hypothetical protein
MSNADYQNNVSEVTDGSMQGKDRTEKALYRKISFGNGELKLPAAPLKRNLRFATTSCRESSTIKINA